MNVVDANWIVEHYPLDDEDVLILAQFCEETDLHHEELRRFLKEGLVARRKMVEEGTWCY